MKFSYNTVIGRSPSLWRWHVDNVLRNAGISRSYWDFNVYLYYNEKIPSETTDELISICKENNIAHELHYENPHESFLNRLYAAWNRVQLMGQSDVVIRGGSDQAFAPFSFSRAFDHWERESAKGEVVLNFQTIESDFVQGQSRHYVRPFGTTPETFNETAFVDFADTIAIGRAVDIHEAMSLWDGKPGPFHSSLGYPHYRGDGASWMMSKGVFMKYGPMPPMQGGFTGDVLIHDRMERARVRSLILGDVITYHLAAGESRERFI